MKKLSIMFCAVLAFVAIPLFIVAQEDAAKTLKGEPIDIQCYLSGRSGSGHASCAQTCVTEKGLPAGLVVEESGKKQIYVVIAAQGKTIADLLTGHMGKQVNVTGKISEKDGLKVITAEKVEDAA